MLIFTFISGDGLFFLGDGLGSVLGQVGIRNVGSSGGGGGGGWGGVGYRLVWHGGGGGVLADMCVRWVTQKG